MAGVVTRNAEELDWAEFDRGFYEVVSVSGQTVEPVPAGASMVSCFADTATAKTAPELVPVDGEGNRATPEQPYFDWGYVCPTAESYREGLLETIADCAAVSGDVRLDDVGFPRAEYCRCERCEAAFADSPHDDREEWRAAVIADFVAAARDRVDGDLAVTLHPDPYPGRLRARSGVVPERLADAADEFVVPIYDTAYETTYWIEALAGGFADRLDTPFSVELYAAEPPVENLARAYEVASGYADDVLFGYGSGNARAVLRRTDAETRDGVEHRPE